jgi:hypothetical protein
MTDITDIDLPYNGWQPRPHQKKLWRYLARGGKRAMAIWHRRAGKDEVLLHHTSVSMMERPANFWTCLPEYAQARKALWSAVNPHTGIRRIDEVFPRQLRATTDEGMMFIRYHNGATWQCIGSDTYDSTMGSSCAGLTMSEAALSNPAAWAYFKPMIEENNGWAAFISTPRGKNHTYDMFKYAQRQPGWFAELLTAEQTGALTKDKLDEALAEYQALYGEAMGSAQYRQEYLCDWNAGGSIGSFYTVEMLAVRDQGRVLEVEALEGQPVHRSWDIGMADDTSVWWWQNQGAQCVILDCYSNSSQGLEHYAELIENRNRERGWIGGIDYVPHDAKVREWGTGKTRVETMRQLGLSPMLVQDASLQDGINAVRQTLQFCVFHPRCEKGISALEQYKREWDDDLKTFKKTALHDWTSHYADSFRYLSLSWKHAPRREIPPAPMEGWIIPPPEEPRRGRIIL